eukprot:2501242-Amphidinium_carterae.1
MQNWHTFPSLLHPGPLRRLHPDMRQHAMSTSRAVLSDPIIGCTGSCTLQEGLDLAKGLLGQLREPTAQHCKHESAAPLHGRQWRAGGLAKGQILGWSLLTCLNGHA